ncbi:MAG: DNA translocase FtsK [Bdellovibrionota bacterium]
MATEKNKKSLSRLTFLSGNLIHFNADYQREVFFITVFGITLYYFTALISYSPLDPSWVAFSYPATKITNLAGRFGANISGIVIYYLGLGSYILPMPAITAAVFTLIKVEKPKSIERFIGWLLAIFVAVSFAAGFFPPTIYHEYPLPSGGVFGTYLYSILTATFGKTGSNILLATFFVTSFILITRISFINPAGRLIKKSIINVKTRTKSKLINLFSKTGATKTSIDESEGIKLIQETSSCTYQHANDYTPIIENISPILGDQIEITNPKEQTSKPFDLFQKLHITPSHNLDRQAYQYRAPSIDIFMKSPIKNNGKFDKQEMEQTASLLLSTLQDFNIAGKIIGFQPGPVVTVYEFQPEAGIKQSKVLGLIDDIALALKVDSIFINPVKGKRALGVQVPNSKRDTVFLGDILSSDNFKAAINPLTFAMGKSLNGDVVCADLASMPHLLVAGSTGSGKSVGINALLCSILMKSSPSQVRMILVDPKMLELSVYDGIPHLLMPVITESTKANLALKWAVNEMERRYKLMQNACVRNIEAFNSFWSTSNEEDKNLLREKVEDEDITQLPYILLVIDELADLMLTAPKEIESIIQRLAQKARASGIHMVLATQRPSVDIITGVIKANLPSRIAFQVVSKHDSRTILDQMGADKLLGKGDMLFQKPGINNLERIQGALVSDNEVVSLVKNLKSSYENAEYDDKLINWIEEEADRQSTDSDRIDAISEEEDSKWDEAISIGQSHGVISASFLQRHLKIGYNRAARIVEMMEKQGLVAHQDGSKPRKWLGPSGHEGL